MLIATAPVAIPVSTAHPPTEAVASEAVQKTPVPETTPATENPNTRNSTDNQQQNKVPAELNRGAQQEQSADADSDESSEQSKQQQEQAQQLIENREIEELTQRDREVRAHEAAHASAGGALAGAPQLSFTTGPNGKRYAVAGEVAIDTSVVTNDPQATINKMAQVRKAALAPANPSQQDLKVASMASQLANQALVELNIQRNQEAGIESSTSIDNKDSKLFDNQRSIRFANPVTARRSSLQLNQRLVDSGAFEESERVPLLSEKV